MNENSHPIRNTLLLIAGVAVAGWIVFNLLGFIFHLLFYVAVGALAIGGGYYLYARGRNALREGRVSRRIGR